MLRGTFRFFQPASLFIILPLIMGGLWLPQFISPQITGSYYPMPLFFLLEEVNNISPWLGIAIAFVMVYCGGILINSMVNRYEMFDQRTSMVALVFCLAISSLPGLRSLHPVHPAGLLILSGLFRLFSVYRQHTAYSPVFDAGVLLGLASLFYLPSLLLFPALWIFLIIMRPFIWREYALALIGLLLPFLFAGVFYFMFYRADYLFLDLMWNRFQAHQYNFFINDRVLLVLLWYLVALLAISLPSFMNLLGRSIVRSQNLHLTITWLFLISAAAVAQSGIILPSDYALVAIPFSIPVAWFFISFRRKWLPELLLLIWIALIVFQTWW